jgi:drug/metabolite transporter (DMT)-like permease
VKGRAVTMLLVAMCCWGSSYHITAIAGRHASGLWVAALRPTIAAAVLLALMPLLRARLPRGQTLAWAMVTGVLMVAVFFIGLVEGTLRAGAADASVLTNSSPFFVLVFSWIALGERLAPGRIAGLVVGFVGVVLMVSSHLSSDHHDTHKLLVGMALALMASVAWAAGTMIVRRLAVRDPDLDVIGLTATQYAVGGAILLVLVLAVDGTGGTDWSSGELWGAALSLSVVSSSIGVLLFFFALQMVSAPRASAFQFLVPAVAVVIEIALGNTPSALVLVGIVLAIAGVAIVNAPSDLIARLAPTRSRALR